MKNKMLKRIFQIRIYHKLVIKSKKVLLNDKQVSLHDVMVVFWDKIKRDEILERADGVAFSFTLAIFPTIIFLFTLIPYLQAFIPELRSEIMDFLNQAMPPSLYNAAKSTIEDIIGKERGDLLSFGFFFALILATHGMVSLMHAFNRCYRTVEKRGFLKTRLIATALTFMLAFVFLLSILLLIIGGQVLSFLQAHGIIREHFLHFLIISLRFVIIFIVYLITISIIYYFAPAIHKKWQFFSPGSLIATLLCIAVSFGFSYYINSFGTYNKLYGSIGAMIAIMVWLFMFSVILLLGFEFNASIDKAIILVEEKKKVLHDSLLKYTSEKKEK